MTTNKLEDSLAGLYKGAPHISANGRKALVEWVPWINLLVGLLTLWSAWILWHWAHVVNRYINYINFYATRQIVHHLSFGIWLGLIVVLAEAVLLITAFVQTRDRKKSGWDLMLYAALLNVFYAAVLVFTDYGGLGHLLWEIIASAIGLYFLFEIRSFYKVHVAKSDS
jgi:hypothetical protein